MEKKIALCIDPEPFLVNRIFDIEVAKQYPGAVGVALFARLVKENGYEIATGDVAVENIKLGQWKPQDVIVIQDMDCKYGLELIELGAEPEIIISMESPIFAHPFYDNLPKLAPKFNNRMLFNAAFDLIKGIPGSNYQVYFPIFHKDCIPPIVEWADRKFMAIVAANKHYRTALEFPSSLSLGKIKRWMKKTRKIKSSPSLTLAIKNELQTKRLEAIEYFANQGRLDIFGRQWDNLDRMPAKWRNRLKDTIAKLNPTACDDKVATLSRYKFAICFENIVYSGYVTEKIIDCLVAGTIPIYMGAPDIDDFVPTEAFIDLRQFDSWDDLDSFISNITAEKAMEIINAGRAFLQSEKGQRHTFESYAQTLFELITRE